MNANYLLKDLANRHESGVLAFMHDFTGKTSKVRGMIRLGDQDRLADAEACVTIDAASQDDRLPHPHPQVLFFTVEDYVVVRFDVPAKLAQ